MRAIRAAARDNNVTLVVGVIERCDGPVSGPRPEEYGSAAKGGSGTIYCTCESWCCFEDVRDADMSAAREQARR